MNERFNRFFGVSSDLEVVEPVDKGDYPGHPFRGNQWVKVGSVRASLYNNIHSDPLPDNLANLLIEDKMGHEPLTDGELKAKIASDLLEGMRAEGITDDDIIHFYEEMRGLNVVAYFGTPPEAYGGSSYTATSTEVTSDLSEPYSKLGESVVNFMNQNSFDAVVEGTLLGTQKSDYHSVNSRNIRYVTDGEGSKYLVVRDDGVGGETVRFEISPTSLQEMLLQGTASGNSGRGTQMTPEQFRERLYNETGLAVVGQKLDATQTSLNRVYLLQDLDSSGASFASNEKLLKTVVVEPVNVVSGVVQSWAQSSGSAISLFVGESAHRLLGASAPKAVGDAPWEKQQFANAQSLSPRSRAVIDAFTLTSYKNTQKALKDAGVREVTLIRGLTVEGGGFIKDTVANARIDRWIDTFPNVEIGGRPLQAWTQTASIAHDFTNTHGRFVVTTVPASRIFSTPSTSFGCRAEDEFVVIGKKNDTATVVEFNKFLATGSYNDQRRDIANEIDLIEEIPTLSKRKLYIDMDAKLSDSDWLRLTFDFPDITNTNEYMKAFAISTPSEAQAHIDENRELNYWKGVPGKIKAELALYAMNGRMR